MKNQSLTLSVLTVMLQRSPLPILNPDDVSEILDNMENPDNSIRSRPQVPRLAPIDLHQSVAHITPATPAPNNIENPFSSYNDSGYQSPEPELYVEAFEVINGIARRRRDLEPLEINLRLLNIMRHVNIYDPNNAWFIETYEHVRDTLIR